MLNEEEELEYNDEDIYTHSIEVDTVQANNILTTVGDGTDNYSELLTGQDRASID